MPFTVQQQRKRQTCSTGICFVFLRVRFILAGDLNLKKKCPPDVNSQSQKKVIISFDFFEGFNIIQE
jgi:hypothetical protein